MTSSSQAMLNYVDILEKTNQQLSLWYNPYGVLVGILGLFMALLAIFFAYILWRQGRDYKDAFSSFLIQQKKFASSELRKVISRNQSFITKQIEVETQKLKDLRGEAKKEVEKEIEDLRKTKNALDVSSPTLENTLATGVVPGAYSPWFNLSSPISTSVSSMLPHAMICPSCGYNNFFGSETIYCTKCGTKLTF